MQQRRPPAPSQDAAQVHQIYVKVVGAGEADKTSRKITLQLLSYIHSQLRTFAAMGVRMRVNKITSQGLKDPRLLAAMRRRGITRLPAVTTADNVYMGLKEICDLYDRNVREYNAIAGREERPVQGATAEEDDVFRSYYKNEMTLEMAESDANEVEVGEGRQNLADAHREMMNRREQMQSGRPGRAPAARPTARPAAPPGRRAPPAAAPPAAAGRPSNVAPLDDPEEAGYQDLMDRLSRDIDDNMRTAALTATDEDDDTRPNPQDDLMERAYYGNQVSSDNL